MSEALAPSAEVMEFLNKGEPPKISEQKEEQGRALEVVPDKNPKPAPKPTKVGYGLTKVAKGEAEAERRVAVTIRLPQRLANGLIDASAQRRKERAKIRTQQDIVTEVLEAWLKRNGFLSG